MQLNNEQRKLVEKNHNLIYQFLIDNKLSHDEYYDIAAIGLCNAAMKYDGSKGIAFSTYAYKTISNTIKKYVIYDKRHTVDTMSYNVTSTVYGDDTEVEYLETFKSNDNTEEENVTKMFFKWFIEYMSLRELQIVYYKTKNYTDTEISKKYGVTHSMISRIWRRIKSAYHNNDRLYTAKYIDTTKDEKEIEMLKEKILDAVEFAI